MAMNKTNNARKRRRGESKTDAEGRGKARKNSVASTASSAASRRFLSIKKEPSEKFYKDEAGKKHCMTAIVSLVEGTKAIKPKQRISLTASLYYEDRTRVEDSDQDILVAMPGDLYHGTIDPATGECVFHFRINKVSRRKDGKKFRLCFAINHENQPHILGGVKSDFFQQYTNVSSTMTRPIFVLSKRKLHKRVDARECQERKVARAVDLLETEARLGDRMHMMESKIDRLLSIVVNMESVLVGQWRYIKRLEYLQQQQMDVSIQQAQVTQVQAAAAAVASAGIDGVKGVVADSKPENGGRQTSDDTTNHVACDYNRVYRSHSINDTVESKSKDSSENTTGAKKLSSPRTNSGPHPMSLMHSGVSLSQASTTGGNLLSTLSIPQLSQPESQASPTGVVSSGAGKDLRANPPAGDGLPHGYQPNQPKLTPSSVSQMNMVAQALKDSYMPSQFSAVAAAIGTPALTTFNSLANPPTEAM